MEDLTSDVDRLLWFCEYLTAARDLLPSSFGEANVQVILNCPKAVVEVFLIIDPAQETSDWAAKRVPCERKEGARPTETERSPCCNPVSRGWPSLRQDWPEFF
jgi:hypothetical protein